MRHRTGLTAILLLAPILAMAQDAGDTQGDEIDSLEPGVDTSSASADSQEPDDNLPAESESMVAATRSQSNGYVMDRLELGRTEITGNQELPKVLYIVPWQKAGPGDLLGRPVNSLLDEVLAPIDRDEFVRDVGYYDELNSGLDDRAE